MIVWCAQTAYIDSVMNRNILLPALLSLLSLGACSTELVPSEGDFVKGEDGKSDSSAQAIFLEFEFDASFLTDSSFNPNKRIEDQLLYTIGQLNGRNSVGRLDKLVLSDVAVTTEGSRKRISYHATMPVAWGNKNNIPSTHTLRLPSDMGFASLTKFAEEYGHSCVDFGAHDVDQGSMWYYFRPERSGCSLSPDDVIETTAAVSISSINTTGKYPEYDKVWEDDALKVVAIFGKYEDGATTSSDAGVAAYNQFARSIKSTLNGNASLETVPASIPSSPGVEMPELQYTADIGGGKSVVVHAFLVDNIRTAPASFNARYEELTGDADIIAYNGHAGLGANIRALAQKGRWESGQYSIVFMNGCDTYAYVDSSLADAHSAINADDPNGTKYLDIVTNAMPSFFSSMPNATMALINGLLDHENPKNYESIFRNVDSSEVVLVSGEQDNTFVPGGGGNPTTWDGMNESGTVKAKVENRFETPVLEAGRYEFTLTGTGDADLYVRLGTKPTTSTFDCRPFLTGSDETCTVEVTTPTAVHVMVRGWAANSSYTLEGK